MTPDDWREYADGLSGDMTPEQARAYRRTLTEEDLDDCVCAPGARVGRLVAIVKPDLQLPPGASWSIAPPYKAKDIKR